ncbi:Voltage-dependent N-type calcium channel subunit alpha-1B [Symbiodinium microadriaticum]|uniref:Voltage-dependent N-type calcium channel subunit alpha-1B n=1 Tax=Symbiodinium microadriaticum TaxID=2951 RepID=A0A1Q9EL14_SYMMI|nr:Voltage-dependent N-type calcium channel subunit alpha-1B [Symbiodinium microadriaticum]
METTLATGDDPDPDLDGEEFLERPPRTNFVRPGVSSACSEQVETLSDFLRKSHQEERAQRPGPSQGLGARLVSVTPGTGLKSTFEEADQLLKDCAAAVDADEAAEEMGLGGAAGPQFSVRPLLRTWAAGEWLAWVVVSNSIFIGVEAIQWAYTAMFTLELILRIGGNGKSFFCSEEWAWNYLDIFVVPLRLQILARLAGDMERLTSVWEKVADVILRTGALRLVRISRLVKADVVRLARVLRFVMALRTLISSIIYTLKSLVWAMILLCLIVYVFAVLFTQAAGDFLLLDGATLLEPAPETSMLALFMSIAGGVSWMEVVGELQLLSTGWVFVFIFYIAFTYFAVLNVAWLTEISLDSTSLSAIDSAQNDQMLEDQVNSPEVQTYFEAIGLDVWDAWSFFKLLDSDGGPQALPALDRALEGTSEARSMDLIRVMRDQAWLLSQQSRFWTYMEVHSPQHSPQHAPHAPPKEADEDLVQPEMYPLPLPLDQREGCKAESAADT